MSQCGTVAQSWCYSSGRCSERGSGCEVVQGCREAMEAKTPKNDEAKFQADNRCEEGLVQGKKDQRQCFCSVDKEQRHVTDSASRCADIQKIVENDKAQASDHQESDLAVRQCQTLKSRAEQCCSNPESCMKKDDLKEFAGPKPGEAVHQYCRRIRDTAAPNNISNANAGAVCTSAWAKCQTECETSATEYSQSEAAPKLMQLAKSCAGLSSVAQLLGQQGLESAAGSFGGQYCSDESVSMQETIRLQKEQRELEKTERAAAGFAPRDTEALPEEIPLVAATRFGDLAPVTQKPRSGDSGAGPARSPTMATLDSPDEELPLEEDEPGMPTYWAARFEPSSQGASSNALAARAGSVVRSAGSKVYPGQRYYRNEAGGLSVASAPSASPGGYAPSSVVPSASKTKLLVPISAQGQVAKEGEQKGQAKAISTGGGFVAMSAGGAKLPARDLASARGSELKKYLPGGVLDPRAKVAGVAPRSRDGDIHGQHTNLFEVVTGIIDEKCLSGELFDCR